MGARRFQRSLDPIYPKWPISSGSVVFDPPGSHPKHLRNGGSWSPRSYFPNRLHPSLLSGQPRWFFHRMHHVVAAKDNVQVGREAQILALPSCEVFCPSPPPPPGGSPRRIRRVDAHGGDGMGGCRCGRECGGEAKGCGWAVDGRTESRWREWETFDGGGFISILFVFSFSTFT